jgi:hypothetical protein
MTDRKVWWSTGVLNETKGESFMRNIDLLNDVGAPAAVTVVNIMARASTKMIGTMPVADVATYAMAGGGYLSAWMGWGGRYTDLVKNIGIAAAPLAFEKLYNMFRGTPVTHRTAMRVSRYPGPATEAPFQGVRLV